MVVLVHCKFALLQVPAGDLRDYSLAVVEELFDPLLVSLEDAFLGAESLATVLLCETVLSILPSMSVRDMPYALLREYNIAPLGQGVIARKRRLVLSQCCKVHRGVLHVPRQLFHRVFLPLVELPSYAKRPVIEMLKFLEKLRVSDRREATEKAASILVEQFLEDLIRRRTV